MSPNNTNTKWAGLLDVPEPPPLPRPSRAPLIALAIAGALIAAALAWAAWPARTPPEPRAEAPSAAPTTTAPPPSPPPAPATTQTTAAAPDVFEPARQAAHSWITRFYTNRTPTTTWKQVDERLAPLQTWALGVQLAERPDLQDAPTGTAVTAVTYSDETADPHHPTSWTATATIALDNTTTARARITVVPDPDTVDGGWKVDEWTPQP